jgi:hypothetical protein
MSNASINAIFGQSHVGGGDPLTIAGMATFQEKIPTLVVAKANKAKHTTNSDTFDITGGASDNIAHAESWLYPHLAHDRFKTGEFVPVYRSPRMAVSWRSFYCDELPLLAAGSSGTNPLDYCSAFRNVAPLKW